MLAELAAFVHPLAAIRPMQLNIDIDFRRGALREQFVHEHSIRNPAVRLIRRFAEPTILRQRQAYQVCMPILDRALP